MACFRRRVIGVPSNTAQNITAPPLFHGTVGAWFAALLEVEIVSVGLCAPLAIEMELELKPAVTFPELLMVAKVTVPEYAAGVRVSAMALLLPELIVIASGLAVSV